MADKTELKSYERICPDCKGEGRIDVGLNEYNKNNYGRRPQWFPCSKCDTIGKVMISNQELMKLSLEERHKIMADMMMNVMQEGYDEEIVDKRLVEEDEE